MYILLGNLMQNAIDAADNCENKQIEIVIRYDRSCIFIRISNPYSGELQYKNGEYLTTKTNKNDHGLGIQSVKEIVERYDGSIYFTGENGHFIVKAVLLINDDRL